MPAAAGLPPSTSRARVVPAYHRMLVRDSGADWRLVVVVVLELAGLVLGSSAVLLLVVLIARVAGDPGFVIDLTNGVGAVEMLATNLGLAALVPLSMLIGYLVYRVRPRHLSSVRPGIRWHWLGHALVAAAAVWTPLLVLGIAGVAASGAASAGSGVLWFIVVVLVTTPLQAAGEEYAFRGVLLQALGATRLPTTGCCLASGALFAVAHLQFSVPLFADRLLLGSVLAWLAISTGGLEAGICVHAVKNIAVLVPAGLIGSVSTSINPTGVTWVPVAVDAVLLAVVAPWILRLYARSDAGRQRGRT